MRIGQGYDVHAFEPGRRLVLGGVIFEGETGLSGHSDADVLTHAIIDALLGAAALGDIGTRFPSSDEQWRDANSLDMLADVGRMLAQAGFSVASVDSTLVCQLPKIAPQVTQMRHKLAQALDIAVERVSVKATTTDGLGAMGRGEGIAAMAVALIEDKQP
jgi:2-C-methyl-D-erythritol 2,4-cyclodiphosphate synthase